LCSAADAVSPFGVWAVRGANVEGERRQLRQEFGVEFLIAADIIDTLMKPTTQDLIALGSIVAIRTVISYSLNSELAHEGSTRRRTRNMKTILVTLALTTVFALAAALTGDNVAGKLLAPSASAARKARPRMRKWPMPAREPSKRTMLVGLFRLRSL